MQWRPSEYASLLQINSKHLKTHLKLLKAGFHDRMAHCKYFENFFIFFKIVTCLELKVIIYKKLLLRSPGRLRTPRCLKSPIRMWKVVLKAGCQDEMKT